MQTRIIRVQANQIGGGHAPADITVTVEFSETSAQWHWSPVMEGKPSTWHGPFNTENEAYEAAADSSMETFFRDDRDLGLHGIQ